MEITVSTKAALQQALKENDLKGLTIKLEPGDYPNIGVGGFNENPLTITSAKSGTPARVPGMAVYKGSNVVLDNLDLLVHEAAEATINWQRYVLRTRYCSNLSVGNCRLGGTSEAVMTGGIYGAFFRDTEDIDFFNNTLRYCARGAVFGPVKRVHAHHNNLRNIRSDGFDFYAANGVEINNNEFYNFHAAAGDHADYIQFWTTNSKVSPSDIHIHNNFMAQSGGSPVQCIFMNDEISIKYLRVLIENNIAYVNGWHGISVYNAHGLGIKNNTIINLTDIPEGDNELRHLWIMVRGGDALTHDVRDNIATWYEGQPDGTYPVNGNINASAAGPFGIDYSKLFTAPLTMLSSKASDFQIVNPDVTAGADASTVGISPEPTPEPTPEPVPEPAPEPEPVPEPTPEPVPEPEPIEFAILDAYEPAFLANALEVLGHTRDEALAIVDAWKAARLA